MFKPATIEKKGNTESSYNFSTANNYLTINDRKRKLEPSNEEQTAFWIMQLVNDSVAVKVPVQKGIEKNKEIEIASPPLSDSARILLTGNYGLGDTAKVKVEEGEK